MDLLMRTLGQLLEGSAEIWLSKERRSALIIVRDSDEKRAMRNRLERLNLSVAVTVETVSEALSRKTFLEYAMTSQSLRTGKTPLEAMGGLAVVEITYDLGRLDHVKKTLFGYALRGRGAQDGILQKLAGRTVGRNSLCIPSGNLPQMEDFLGFWKVDYSKRAMIELSGTREKSKASHRSSTRAR